MNSRPAHQRRPGGRSVAQPQRPDAAYLDPNLWTPTFPAASHISALAYTPIQIPQQQQQQQLAAPSQSVTAIPINNSFVPPNEWLNYLSESTEMSPTDSDTLMSPMSDAAMLPSYGANDFDGTNFQDFKISVGEDDHISRPPQFNPFVAQGYEAQTATQGPLVTVDPLQLTAGEKNPEFSPNGTPKQRSAHRKAIEEKSSVKRKKAEHRLVTAISTRLGGTFVPGLANQLNQAAELLEKDQVIIQRQEEEIKQLQERLKGYQHQHQHFSDMKHPLYQ